MTTFYRTLRRIHNIIIEGWHVGLIFGYFGCFYTQVIIAMLLRCQLRRDIIGAVEQNSRPRSYAIMEI